MFKIKRKENIIFLISLVLFVMLVPLFLGSINFSSNYGSFLSSTEYQVKPYTSDFSIDDYNKTVTEEKHALGNITITDMDLSDLELGIYIHNSSYPLIYEDYNSNALNFTRTGMKFVETTDIATQNNLDEDIVDSNLITVKINETLDVKYNNSQAKKWIYLTRLFPPRLLNFSINNGSDIIELVKDKDFTIDSDDFVVFEFDTYFQKGLSYNFSIYFIWEYDVRLETWNIDQNTKPKITVNEEEESFPINFNYHFNLWARKYGDQWISTRNEADNIYFALTVNLPDKDFLSNYSLGLDEEIVNINTHLTIEDSINVFLSNSFNGNYSLFSLNFSSSFTIKFIDPVERTWSLDRLYANRNKRERIYIPSLISGPEHILLKFVSIYEPGIYYEQVESSSSVFERDVAYFNINSTLTGKQGTYFQIPYLIRGETCPFIIKYETSLTLKIIITNNIKMPLVGAKIEVFYYGQEFGTFISLDKSQPLALPESDDNGEILLRNVPHGNYTVKVYYNGRFIKEADTSTYRENNFIYTSIPHIPIWILIFGLFNGVILVVGVIFYLKYKKKR